MVGLIGTFAFTIGCGGGASKPATQPTAKVQVKIADAPSDRVIALELKVNSIVLTNSSGGTVPVLASPTEVELSHLAATMEPLSLNDIPQGNYTSATITVSSPQVTFMDPTTGLVVEKNATLTTNTASFTFNPSVSIGSTLTSLNFDFDLNLPNSITIDANNNVAFTPMFTASAVTMVAENLQEEDDGLVDDLVGFVTAASGSSFSILAQDASQTLSFVVDGNTQFEGVSGASALSNGMIVEVSAVTQPDNSLLATHVELRIANANGEEAEGLITQVIGTPATQFNIVVRDEATSGSVFPALGSMLTVNLAQNTLYNINTDHVDLGNLPFVPKFDATSLAKAQNVEADTDNPSSTSVIAQAVELQPQAIVGTVTAYVQTGTQATFVLTVPSDSAFAILTGSTTITVFQQQSTELKDITAITNGSSVRVRGLLFLDLGTYKLVASRVGKP
jgi:hypothetical protein